MEDRIRRLQRRAATGDEEAQRQLKSIYYRTPSFLTIEKIMADLFGDQSQKPPVSLTFEGLDINYKINTWHFVVETTKYLPELQEQYLKWATFQKQQDFYNEIYVEDFIEEMDPEAKWEEDNTQNYRSFLTYPINYILCNYNSEKFTHDFAVLDYFGDMKIIDEDLWDSMFFKGIFVKLDLDYFGRSDNGLIVCDNENCGAGWHSRSAGNDAWPPAEDSIADEHLDAYPAHVMDSNWSLQRRLNYDPSEEILLISPDSSKGYCPVCRIGLLTPARLF